MEAYQKEALKLGNQLCFPLYAAARHITGLYTPVLKPLGLTYTQYLVLLVLWEEERIPMAALGEKLYLDSGTLTPLLKKMETAGLICRERCREDERCLTVSLTEENGKYVLKTNVYQLLKDFRAGLVNSDVLGEAFEPEQRFENPDGSDIIFDRDYLGEHRGLDTVPGPFADTAEERIVWE